MQNNFTIPQAVRELVPPRSAFTSAEKAIHPGPSEYSVVPAINTPTFYGPWEREKLFYQVCKRSIDIGASFALLVLLSPVMLVIALLIKIGSPGPVIYRHRRLGRYGHEFDCWKFRTMVCDAEDILRNNPTLQKAFEDRFKIDDDPRVTRLGSCLRRTSMDELPQLIQVLQGKMSLIGPRPIIAREIQKYSIYGSKLLGVKPGLGGLWQTSGRSDTTYTERVALDMRYIDNRCLLLDMKLLARTVVTVITKAGAC